MNFCLKGKNVTAKISTFKGASSNTAEYHAIFCINEEGLTLTYDEQLKELLDSAEKAYISNFNNQVEGLANSKIVFKRYYLSDAANQQKEIELIEKDSEYAVSIIQQSPLNGSKVALWCCYMENAESRKTDDGIHIVSHDGYDELWSIRQTASGLQSYTQTEKILTGYADTLKKYGCRLADNCIRTWLFVNDIDNQYAGVVNARNAVFNEEGLTEKTHYIASTGIGGRDHDHKVFCKMDAIAIKGIKKEQIHYLYALDHLNRTSEYGVRFERGTYVDFAGRRRVYISGTASIDNKGEIMYKGDIRKQTLRMWENIEALLKEAGCSFQNVAQFAIYLRDIADYKVVERMFSEKFPDTPYIILHAPVCRPGWLIESECIAIKEI